MASQSPSEKVHLQAQARVAILSLASSLPSTIRKLSEKWNTALANKVVKIILEDIKAKTGNQHRKVLTPLIYCQRTIAGVAEGVENGEVNLGKAQLTVKKLLKTHCLDFVSAVKETPEITSMQKVESKEKKIVKLGTAEAKEALEALSSGKQSNATVVAADIDEDGNETTRIVKAADEKIIKNMARMKKKVAKIPKKMNGLMELIEAPVIPVAENFTVLRPDKLIQADIKAVMMADYIILDEQVLLMLNAKRIMQNAREAGEDLRKYTMAYAKKVLDGINKSPDFSKDDKLTIFSTALYRPAGFDVFFIWLMKEGQMAAWSAAGHSNSIKMISWQFPTPHNLISEEKVDKSEPVNKKSEMADLVNQLRDDGFTKDEAFNKFRRLIFNRFGTVVDGNRFYEDLFSDTWNKRKQKDPNEKKKFKSHTTFNENKRKIDEMVPMPTKPSPSLPIKRDVVIPAKPAAEETKKVGGKMMRVLKVRR